MRILDEGRRQSNRKGNIIYLLNQQLSLTPADLLDIFEGHGIARKKLRSELKLFMSGERSVENTVKQAYIGGTIVVQYLSIAIQHISRSCPHYSNA